MRTLVVFLVFSLMLAPSVARAQNSDLQQELELLKKKVAELEQRLADREKQVPAEKEAASVPELKATVDDLEKRVAATEVQQAQDRIRFSGDYRFEAHTSWGDVPSHFDGMQMQNLMVKTLFAAPMLGRFPQSVAEINSTATAHPAEYSQFVNNLSFAQLKQAVGSFPAAQQQMLFGMLMPSTYVPAYKNNNDILYTNRLRLKFDAKVADNVTFTGRLSMYKVFGDSTGVQVFNGQPNSFNIDGTTTGTPNSDQLRVERAYFSWNNIGGSKFYLSIGRRPSTNGPPMNFRDDEPRGGTPSGALIDYQFDGITVGYNLSENMIWRLCYGVGYESGFGNGNLLKMPQDRLKDVHFLGANLDLWNSDSTLIQTTYAHAFNVTDGFNGLIVLPNNPLTGEVVPAPVVMRFTPSANLGAINLLGGNASHRTGPVDLLASLNYSGTRPNGQTTPFGGLMSDPFETPVNRNGYMVLAGARLNFPNDDRTKLGFEFNHGSKYWFNFSNAADDLIAPKTNARGNVYETYLTHRISDRFVFRADFIRYNYDYSGSGWHVGAPKKLNADPLLGFPAYLNASKLAFALIARF